MQKISAITEMPLNKVPLTGIDLINERLGLALAGGAHPRRI